MIGMIYQFIVANHLLGTQFDIQHYINYMNQLNYPLDLIQQIDFEEMYQYMLSDKNNGEGIQMVLLEKLGKPNVYHVEKIY